MCVCEYFISLVCAIILITPFPLQWSLSPCSSRAIPPPVPVTSSSATLQASAVAPGGYSPLLYSAASRGRGRVGGPI